MTVDDDTLDDTLQQEEGVEEDLPRLPLTKAQKQLRAVPQGIAGLSLQGIYRGLQMGPGAIEAAGLVDARQQLERRLVQVPRHQRGMRPSKPLQVALRDEGEFYALMDELQRASVTALTDTGEPARIAATITDAADPAGAVNTYGPLRATPEEAGAHDG